VDSYGPLCTDFYDLDKPEAPPDALAFWRSQAEQAGGPVLEAMCGSGRFLVPLREAGIDIDGVDASPHMLRACRERCAARDLTGELTLQRLEELDLPRRYALAFVTAGSFNLLDDATVPVVLAALKRHLEPGGRLVLELITGAGWRLGDPRWTGRWVDRPDGARIVLSTLMQYEADSRTYHLIDKYELVRGSRLLDTEFEDLRIRAYTLDEFGVVAERAGFRVEWAQDGFDGAPVSEGTHWLVVSLRRD